MPAPVTPPRISGFSYVRPLGSGGFAQVYQYEQDMPRRVVAVKVLDQSAANDQAAFEAEADSMARLSSHPSIVSIFEASISSDGRPYLAMEFCPASFRKGTVGDARPLNEVLDAGVRLAGALETAHQAGVLHRDIKPSNVLVATTGRPVLADFGIVSLRGQLQGDASRAMSIPWSAPEVVGEQTTGTVASEIWALGATLYNFAAGRTPFGWGKDDSQEKLVSRIKRAKYTPVPGAQGYELFDALIGKALARDPAARFQTMREFGEAMQALQRHYGFEVTQLDVVSAAWVPPAAQPGQARGVPVSAVSPEQGSRAQRRATLAEQLGSTQKAQHSSKVRAASTGRGGGGSGSMRPVLIGVGAAVAVLGVAAVVFGVAGGFA